MQTACAMFGTCVCGVAVRNDKDIFTANFCGDITMHYVSGRTNRNNYIEAQLCDDTHMVIENIHERIYKVLIF